jgi:hypothetical protein
VGKESGTDTTESRLEAPGKVKIELLCDPELSVLAVSPKEGESVCQRERERERDYITR